MIIIEDLDFNSKFRDICWEGLLEDGLNNKKCTPLEDKNPPSTNDVKQVLDDRRSQKERWMFASDLSQ